MMEEEYLDLVKRRNNGRQVIAILCFKDSLKMMYVMFEMGNRNTINWLLGKCDGKAIPMEFADREYWLLMSEDTNRLLLFRKDNNGDYFDISPDVIDMTVMDNIADM